ncbi:MAG: trimethylamine methyltransferase family protein [Kiritimatiellaeota bacterium]|nr:trimethylamine methyltransferase family protein [Kiritimatiellota bacterium]
MRSKPFQMIAEPLHRATLDLLARVGVRVESTPALELLAARQVRIDMALRRVYPDARQIEAMLGTAPRTFPVYGRQTDRPLIIGGDTPHIIAGGASVRVLDLDGRYVTATWGHLRQFITLLDALPCIHLLLNQVDPAEETQHYYLRLAAEMLIGSPKPCALQAQNGADVTAMVAMAACIRGSRGALADRPLFVTGTNAEPPLCIPAHAAEVLMTASAAGVPCGLGDYVMMGITAPVTTAGALVQRNAVQLTALLLIQLVHPGAPCYYSAASGAGCLRTLNSVTANPQAVHLVRLATQQGRFYGLPVWAIAPTDARQPDSQAACERTIFLQTVMDAGASLIQGPTSMMDQMMLSSFAQAIIDHDIIGYLLAARQNTTVNADTLAAEAIQEVVTDAAYAEMKFAAHPHTVDHLRDDAWRPLAFAYDTFAEWQRHGGMSLVERATSVARDLLDHHQPEPVGSDLAAEIRRIAEVAR